MMSHKNSSSSGINAIPPSFLKHVSQLYYILCCTFLLNGTTTVKSGASSVAVCTGYAIDICLLIFLVCYHPDIWPSELRWIYAHLIVLYLLKSHTSVCTFRFNDTVIRSGASYVAAYTNHITSIYLYNSFILHFISCWTLTSSVGAEW